MKMWKVAVTEMSRKIITVAAETEEEAHQRTYDAWSNTEFVFGEEDFEGVEVHVIGETSSECGLMIDSKE